VVSERRRGRARPAAARKGVRKGSIERETKETRVSVRVDLDPPSARAQVDTGIGMLDHLLEQVGQHGMIDITIKAKGDLHRDAHHTAEDVAICLGRALDEALGDRQGIVRMADALVPLDEALAQVALDLNGRGYSSLDLSWAGEYLGDPAGVCLPTDMVGHILATLAAEGRFTLHARILSGGNDHHKAEALFKALGRALGAATRLDPRRAGQTPSTKGKLV
jgi:imidazoleglycerol-phosphate dehydratase